LTGGVNGVERLARQTQVESVQRADIGRFRIRHHASQIGATMAPRRVSFLFCSNWRRRQVDVGRGGGHERTYPQPIIRILNPNTLGGLSEEDADHGEEDGLEGNRCFCPGEPAYVAAKRYEPGRFVDREVRDTSVLNGRRCPGAAGRIDRAIGMAGRVVRTLATSRVRPLNQSRRGVR